MATRKWNWRITKMTWNRSYFLRRIALTILAERESGTRRWRRHSISLSRGIKGILNRESNPLQWAIIQNNVGGALLALGEKERGTTQFAAEAIFVYHQALEVCTREQMPIDWAETKMDLGTAFHALGTALHAQGAGESGGRGSRRRSPPSTTPCW